MIVSTALDYARNGSDVYLIGADTDLLIMLIYFWDNTMGKIIMKTESTKRFKATEREVGKLAELLCDVRKYITFVHAFGGCDTTSAVHGQGKSSILRLLEKSTTAREEANHFLKKDASPEEINVAGSKLLVSLYGGKTSDSLTELRYLHYMKMSSSSAAIKPENLPPTERAAMYHFRRTYYQVQEWNTLMESTLDPKDWGWRLEGNSLVPITTDKEPAPEELLNVIRCNCRLTSKNPCGGKQCSCRANGLNCVAACGDCRGTDCQNCTQPELTEDDQNENDDELDNLFDIIFR